MTPRKAAEAARLLIVEDEADIRRSLELRLAKEGFAVASAASAAEARIVFAETAPDLCVLDIRLPDEDGLSLCRWLRRSAGFGGPVIFLTARDMVADKVLGLETGADDYLTKPYDFRELAARIRAQLRPKAASAQTLEAGGLSLDPLRQSVSLSGRAVEGLTDTEFKLLDLLVRAAPRALSRSEILRHLWGYGNASLPDTRTVDMHVSRLRAKLGRAGDCLKSAPGVGYRFQP